MNTIPRKRIDRLIPQAISVISEVGIASGGMVASSFHGYISSFGASMVQSSPLAAAVFFEDSSSSQEDRSKLPRAILKLVLWEKQGSSSGSKLSDYIMSQMSSGQVPNSTVTDILAAAIALKIALRTFKQKDNHNGR